MKLRATKKMPRGVLNRYRTRMLTADTFVETSPKWSRFYVKHGWATEAVDESRKAEVEASAEESAPVAEEQEVDSNDEPPASEEPEPEPEPQ